jgi:amino acid adenylation domain-containing protein
MLSLCGLTRTTTQLCGKIAAKTVEEAVRTCSEDLPAIKPESPAYVIMTSGTTGKPKGVLVAHRSLSHYLAWAAKTYYNSSDISSVLIYGFTFDGAFGSIYGQLLAGGTLHILDNETRFDIRSIAEFCLSKKITHIDLPAAMLPEFTRYMSFHTKKNNLRFIITGGEQVKPFTDCGTAVSNEYGPTECTVCVTQSFLTADGGINIGNELPNTKIYILNDKKQLCPLGVFGECYVAGVQVALGYLGGENNKAFTANPFGDGQFELVFTSVRDGFAADFFAEQGGRRMLSLGGLTRRTTQLCEKQTQEDARLACEDMFLYRTGDRVRFIETSDGYVLEFSGRTDGQIKLNGFRIETGEIEQAALKCDGVTGAVALLRGTYIALYAVCGDAAILEKRLREALPHYMQPVVIPVPFIPLTESGKPDQAKLSEYKPVSINDDPENISPAGKILCGLVFDLIGVKVSAADNFTAIGGNSVTAMKLSFLLAEKNIELSPADIIRSKNFAELSDKMVEREGSAKHNHDIAFTPPDSLKSMIYLSQKFGETLYAVTAQKPCASSRGEVETRIKQAAEMHDILRCTFAIDPQGNISAIIKTSPNIKFLGETEDLPDSIDPLGETLAYVSLRDDRLTVRYHHIILDGYSINLLLSELAEGIFPETAESYSDFANAISDEKIKEKDHEFYGQALRNCEAVTLFDNTNPPEKLCALRCFDDEFLEEIRIAACKIPVTPAVFIMAAFGVFLCAYGDTNKTYIPVVASFRNTGGLMGCAAQTFPAVFSAHADFKDFNRAATELRDSLTAATAHVNIPEEYLGLPYIFVDDSDSTSGSLNDSQNYGLVITSGGSILYDENSVAPALLETIKTRFFAALKNALSGRTSVFTEGEYYLVRDVFPFGNTVGKKHDYLDKINDAKALGIAEQLRHLGIGPGDCVMAEEERRDEALLSYAGISLAGAAFLPMDTDLPRQRKDEITADCRPAALIKNGEITAFARADAMKFDSDTAYIIYTSGTTGKPKGVPISKTALQSQINWTIDEFSFSKDDIILHYINFAFDPSVWVIYSAFASGAKTAVVPEDIRALPQKIAEFITERKITIAVLPAAAAYDILDNLKDNSLRLVFLGGDKINIPKRTNYTQSIVFINLYGPTETCINASFYRLPTDARQTACIGKPVSGTNIYILDKAGQPSPVGIKGEIYIGGDKLSGGYINRPTETASAFIVHAEFGRLYKTGDLAAWNPDGTVDFFGRSDRQVKIRGFRVELSEIEAAVSAAAKSPAAVTYKNGILIGFAGGAFSQKQIMDTLRGMIPAFMLPNRIVKTAQLPLTANGKIDYTGLIAPPETTDETPLGSTEKLVAEAFEEVLSLPAGTAGRNSDFFALGGHSLKLFALTGALAARGLLPGINDILRSPVVADLAEIVDETSVNRRNNANKNVIFDESAYADYVASCESVDMSAKRKADRIMITGATGFLGAHLLREVYRETSAQIFLPVRGETARIKRVLDYYFPGETFDFGRMNIFTADISDKQPEIPEIKGQIDIIYHSAADIRHYAPPQESYKANVAATEHMIRYAKSCNAYLAHISTASAVNKPVIAENDHENGDIFENIYQQTKQKAEQIIMAADNLRYGIYRVGNITPSLEYRVHAQNAESNSYLRLLTLLIKTRTLPDFGGRSGYCFADSAAKAIVLIAQRAFFDNHVFHITNPNILTFRKIFDIMKIEEITDCDVVPDELRGIYAQRAVEKKTDVSANIMNEATLALLRRLGFEWIAPDIDYLKCFTAYHE